MTIRLTQLFGLIGGALMALAALPAAAETPSQKAAALLDGLIKTNVPGLVVLVAQDGNILFEKSYGLAEREDHVPVILQTTFRIGSITKQFTAAAILKLQEEGKLSIDDKLAKYIPDFPRGDEITLRQLLTHTSGIHSYTDEPDFLSRVTNATTTEAIIEEIKKYPFDFDPGTKWRYDNSGYLLLGYIVEKVSGQSYGDFLRNTFFQPLGMTNTGVYHAHLGLAHEALGYSLGRSASTWIFWGEGFSLGKNRFKQALNWDMSWAGGAGALYSTVEDLYRWNEGVFNGRVLDAASLKAAFTPAKMPFWVRAAWAIRYNDWGSGYGLGWVVCCHRGLRQIWHSGSLHGFKSCLLRVPDEKLTVVVLANTEPGRWKADPDRLARKLADIYLRGQARAGPRPSLADTEVGSRSKKQRMIAPLAAREALDKTPMNLTLRQPVIPKENIFLIQGSYDLLVEAEQTEELWKKWQQPEIWRLSHGHISWIFTPGLTRRVLCWLAPRLDKPLIDKPPKTYSECSN